jgi:hypothetical protein
MVRVHDHEISHSLMCDVKIKIFRNFRIINHAPSWSSISARYFFSSYINLVSTPAKYWTCFDRVIIPARSFYVNWHHIWYIQILESVNADQDTMVKRGRDFTVAEIQSHDRPPETLIFCQEKGFRNDKYTVP